MKIAMLSSFYPLRGGIAHFNALLYRALEKDHQVKAYSFKRQYPNILFPGKSQYVTESDEADEVPAKAILDTINPITYHKTFKTINQEKFDLILTKYWMTFFAPSLGYVTGKLRKKNTISIAILDNVVPHEGRFFDSAFNHYFLKRNDGFVVMSDIVLSDLLKLKPDAKYIKTSHPTYNQFGDTVERHVSEDKLKLQKGKKNILFFGLIRAYKGLDLLLEAFNGLSDDYQLIIAGESYEDFKKYQDQIDASKNRENIKVFNQYIPDNEVKYFFSASDVCVLPYKTATQSGIAGIAENFGTPMIVTNVGGLKEYIREEETGLVVESPNAEQIKDTIIHYFEQDLKAMFTKNILIEKENNSWENLATKIVDFATQLKKDK